MEWVRNCKGRFNSMIVRLKASGGTDQTARTGGFNSMIVRLKVMIRPNGRGQFEGFNSMIVRLKETLSQKLMC